MHANRFRLRGALVISTIKLNQRLADLDQSANLLQQTKQTANTQSKLKKNLI